MWAVASKGLGVKAGKEAKEVVIGIRQRNGALRFFHAEDAKTWNLAKYIRENISADVDVIITDDSSRRIKKPSGLLTSMKQSTISAKEYVRLGNGHSHQHV